MEWSEGNSENVSGRDNQVADRRRRRGAPAQGFFQSPMPRPPPPPQVSETSRVETDQQALNRLFTAYNQCVGRTGHLESRFDQFRFAIRRDATDLALVVQGHDQRVNSHSRELRQLTESLEEAQSRIAGLDTFTKTIIAHGHQVEQTIDKYTHSHSASIGGIIEQQEDLRKMVEELASRVDRSQDSLSTPQGEASTGVLLDIGDLKTKVARLIEQHTQMDGDVSFLKSLHESVEALGDQIVKWNNRLPDLNDVTDEDGDKLPTAIEVQEELTSLTNTCFTKFHNLFNRLQALENMTGTLEQSREESWEAVSNRVSTLVESSVTSLTGRLTELEQALHSQRTTPIESVDIGMDAETWAASEQVTWSELGKVKEQLQEVPRLQELFEKIQHAQQSHEKQLSALRRFARHVEQHLEQISNGVLPPKQGRQPLIDDIHRGVSQTYVPGASASSSAIPTVTIQVPTPPIQYATVAGHFPSAAAASVKAKPKKVNKAEVPTEEVKSETQANATGPITPRPKAKVQPKNAAQPTPPKIEQKPTEQNKGGKGSGKGKRGRSESRLEKRNQQCIYFFRGNCQRGDKCKYEHQVGDDGQPIPVAPEIIKRFEDAVKRYGETRAQAKPKAAPRGGVSSSMLILEPDVREHGITLNAAEARDKDEYYAMVDSGTNAIILPLHPQMEGDIAECQVPSATVTGPIVQVYDFNGSKRLVVALPQSTILVSQEWLTTIAEWDRDQGVNAE